jgi:hypothetical protein
MAQLEHGVVHMTHCRKFWRGRWRSLSMASST